jgi:mono/diheme cytochrome c family protein
VINEGSNLTKDADAIADVILDKPSDKGLRNSDANPLQSKFIAIAFFLISIIAIVIFLLRPALDPYTQSVLELSGDPVQGRSIFVMNCVACHGQWANGKVGPNLHGVSERKSDAKLVQQVVSGETPPMPQFQPSPQDMADLLSYLKQL